MKTDISNGFHFLMKYGVRSLAVSEDGGEGMKVEGREGIKSLSQEWKGKPMREN